MKVIPLHAGGVAAVSYLAVCEKTNEAVLIDPAISPEAVCARIGILPTVKAILLSHGHFDHMLTLDAWQKKTGASVCVHQSDAPALSDPYQNASAVFFPDGATYPSADRLLSDGDIVTFGYETLRVMHTPGHTMGSCVYIGDGVIFTGDTMMADGSYGRYDLYGGSVTALRDSLRRILTLEGDYRLYPGRGDATTKDEEKKYYISII